MVALYRALGVRQIHFAYNRNNSVAGGCNDVPQGLTALGRRMVEAVNDAGVLMDCAHTERRTTLDIMAHSRHPVVFSHANPLALAEHGRNITDEQIKACAAAGGVVCVSGISKFLGSETPGAADIARHMAYVADLAGADHVGLGLDIGFAQAGLNDDPPGAFDPEFWWPASEGYGRGISQIRYAPIETWARLPDALRAVGMSETEVEKRWAALAALRTKSGPILTNKSLLVSSSHTPSAGYASNAQPRVAMRHPPVRGATRHLIQRKVGRCRHLKRPRLASRLWQSNTHRSFHHASRQTHHQIPEALADAQSLANVSDNAYMEPQHLLVAMLRQEDGPKSLLQRAGVNVAVCKKPLKTVCAPAPGAGRRTGSTQPRPAGPAASHRKRSRQAR